MTRRLLPILVLASVAFGCGSSAKPNDVGSSKGALLPLAVGNQWTYQITESDGTKALKVQGVTAQVAVGGTGPNKDLLAFRLVTGSKFNDNNGDVSFQAVVNKRVVRFREESIDADSGKLKKEHYWDPPKLRVDDSTDHTTMAAEWLESFTEYVVDKAPKPDDAAGGAGGGGAGGGGAEGGGAGGAGGAAAGGGLVTTSEAVMELWSVAAVNESVTVPGGTFTTIKLKKLSPGSASIRYFWFARGVGKVKEAGEVGSGDQTEELSSYMVAP
jgi:hypothetical protein